LIKELNVECFGDKHFDLCVGICTFIVSDQNTEQMLPSFLVTHRIRLTKSDIYQAGQQFKINKSF